MSHINDIIEVASREKPGVVNDHVDIVAYSVEGVYVVNKRSCFKETAEPLSPVAGVGSTARSFMMERIYPPTEKAVAIVVATTYGEKHGLPVYFQRPPTTEHEEQNTRVVIWHPSGWEPRIG